MQFLRFVILQVLLVAGLAALWMAGPLQQVLTGDSRWFVVGIFTVAWSGLMLIAFDRIEDAARVQDLLPVVAVVAMQIGILSALAVMAQALMSAGDPSKAVGGFFSALSTALYVSVSALCGYLWLKLTLWLAYGK